MAAGVLATAQLAGAGPLSDQYHQHRKPHQYQQSSSQNTSGYQPGGNSQWPPPGWPPLGQPPANRAPSTAPPSSGKPPASPSPSPTPNTGTRSGSNTSAAAFHSPDRWASYSTGGYTLYNNEWSPSSGSQTLWVDSASHWGVSSTQPDTSGVKSYPNISKSIGKPLNSLSSATSSFSQSVPSSAGNWESAYDIWLNGSADEIMVWTYKNGNVAPLGSAVGTVNLDGNTWTLYAGNNGSNPTYSFVRSSNETSGTVDLLGLLKYLKNTMHYFSNPTLSTIQYGFEITSTHNTPQDFAITNYSAGVS